MFSRTPLRKMRRVSGVMRMVSASGGFHFADIAVEIGGELGGEVGGAAGLAGLVVVSELYEHVGGAVGRVAAQGREHRVPGAFGAVAAGAAPVLGEVDAGDLRGDVAAESGPHPFFGATVESPTRIMRMAAGCASAAEASRRVSRTRLMAMIDFSAGGCIR